MYEISFKNLAKIILDKIYVLALMLGILVQFAWHMLLGSEIPTVITNKEFYSFTIFSIVLLLLTLLYLKFQNVNSLKRTIKLSLILLYVTFFTYLWVMGLIDTFAYPRHKYLVLSRYSGFATTLLIILYCIWKIFRSKNRNPLNI